MNGLCISSHPSLGKVATVCVLVAVCVAFSLQVKTAEYSVSKLHSFSWVLLQSTLDFGPFSPCNFL